MAQPSDDTSSSLPQNVYTSATPDPQPSNLRQRCPTPSTQATSSNQFTNTNLPQSSSTSSSSPSQQQTTTTTTTPVTSQPTSSPNTTQNTTQNTTTTQRNNNNNNSFRTRAVAGAVGLGIVTFGGSYLLSDSEAILPFAIAACVLTVSSVLLRFAIFGINNTTASHRARVRHLRHHRHFTGERAAYVRTSQRLAMMDRDFTDADYELLLDLDNNSQRLRRFLEGASRETVDSLPTYFYKMKNSTKSKQINDQQNDKHVNICDDKNVVDKNQDEESKQVKPNDEKLQTKEPLLSEEPELAGATAKSCTICLEDFEPGMKIRILPCFHHFMAECIDPWLTQQARCPVCKYSIQEGMNTLPPGCS